MLDANDGPGGAWRHRWPSLTLGKAHGIHDLPQYPLGTPDPEEPSSDVVSRYYGEYEAKFDLPVIRPAKVERVTSEPDGDLAVRAGDRPWRTRFLINSTGTWDSPFWPSYPGMDVFDGEQLHTRNFWSADDYRGKRVVVVGGGSSAIQFLLQLDDAGAATTWVTRRPPVWRSAPFEDGWGRKVEDRVRARTEAGLLPESVVTATGLALTDEYQRGIEAGVLVSVGALRELSRDGIILDDGRFVPADVVLWATGFRHSIGHLAPLKLREAAGGIRTDGIRAARDPRVFMVGYGASASTLGATRAGRAAAVAVSQALTEARSTAA